MTTTIVFDLITQLVSVCAANVPPGVQVYDGPGASNDPGNFLMVGVGNPDSDDLAESATGTQVWNGLGAKSALEDGSVVCCALAWTGGAGNAAQQSARETCRDIVKSVDAALKSDPNLGGAVPGLNWVRYGGNFALSQRSTADGVTAIFYFEIGYKARL